MAGISRYERIVLGLTAAFLLVTGGWFRMHRADEQPYQITTVRSDTETVPEQETPKENSRPDSMMEGEVINLNTAGVRELERLPGIGEKRAQAIVADREANGLFQTVEDLTRVKGIGSGILAGLEGYVTVETAEG